MADHAHAALPPPPPAAALAHVPGPHVVPGIGHTLVLLRDARGLHGRLAAAHGPVHRIHLFGTWRVALHGADAMQMVLTDRTGLFSSAGGWDLLADLFPGAVMLRDGDDHLAHRRVLAQAFRAEALMRYGARVMAELPDALAALPRDRPVLIAPAMRALALRISATLFLGLAFGDRRSDVFLRDFATILRASVAPIRQPLPFTAMAAGRDARSRLVASLTRLADERRQAGDAGGDLFGQLIAAADAEGGWDTGTCVDHMIFLVMAAHDTTAAMLTAALWALATHPEWQEHVAEEAAALPAHPDVAALETLEVIDRVLREAMRLVPPVPYLPRRAMRSFRWNGVDLPAGTPVGVLPALVLRDPAHWSAPDRFDPDRFAPGRAEDRRHPFAWAPFGGGVHKCLGMNLAMREGKLVLAALLRARRIIPCSAAPVRWREVPIPRPVGGLPLRLPGRIA